FLWVGPEGPHDPFDPPEPYGSMYDPADMPVGPLDHRYPVGPNIASSDIPDATEEEIRRMRAHYMANVTFIDAWLGRLLSTLRTRGLLADTWVVFTSDHGDLLGDHRLVGKGQFFESSVRVPLILRPPDSVAGAGDWGRGVVRDALAELIDVPATLLEIAGADLPGQHGRSLLPLLDPDADDVHREFVTSEIEHRMMISDGDTKLELGPDDRPIHAFDLIADPDEEHDLAGTDAAWIPLLTKAATTFRHDTPPDMPQPWRHLTPYEHWGRNLLREYGADS
ncbi:sulfatase, partial [Phytoactinopolyspora endophytica]|uniref:sulfatase family protein n=1 Tax=Phytoactinopolyspora endophytica TaxID=1642495 RepID=UPI00197C20D9